MDNHQFISELERYEKAIEGILSRFRHDRSGIYIGDGDDPLFRQYVREIVDLFNDMLGTNTYSAQIEKEANEGVSNFYGTPSFKSVENIRSVLRAALTRFNRNPEFVVPLKGSKSVRKRENVFVIHGHDEAKWRELKDLLKNELGLDPLVLSEQPDAGCRTVIEKFEHYAQTCSYAIAVFTPDDQVHADGEPYLQARPNVIYELGWFCGRLGRNSAMLLLKEGTTLFSDFGGIVQKRFQTNIQEKIIEIKKDLVAAGVIDASR